MVEDGSTAQKRGRRGKRKGSAGKARMIDRACQTIVQESAVLAEVQQPTPESCHTVEKEDSIQKRPTRWVKMTPEYKARMMAGGVEIEDSDTSDAESEDEPPPPSQMLTLWGAKKRSKSLYEVAPGLRPRPPPDYAAQFPSPGPRKEVWKNFMARTLQKRREKFGKNHPHTEIRYERQPRMVEVTRLEDFTTNPRMRPLDPPRQVQVEIPFKEYMGMPEELVYAPQTGPNADKQLVFRDGAREKRWLESGASRRTRKGVDQEWVYKL
jgi:hypothetical protein